MTKIGLQQGQITWLIERCRRVEHGDNHALTNPMHHTMCLSNLDPRQPSPRCMPPKRNYHGWLNERNLTHQEVPAGGDFVGKRVTIRRWAVFDHIGNEHLLTRQTSELQQCIE